MKVHNSVASVLHTLELPSAVTAYLENKCEDDDGHSVNGGILQDAKHIWLSNGSKFTVVHIDSGQKIAAWTFGAALRDFKARVTCVCELSPPLIENTMQLLIGLECDLIGGMVCLFHCNGSRVLRAIQIDCQVISIQYIDSFPGSPLNCFDGGVLIGTHGGATLILDLNRQSCAETILNRSCQDDIAVKDELDVANLMVLSIDNIDVIVEQRAIACGKDHHIAIQVNEGCIHNLQFILHNPDNTIKLKVERENVYVTSVLYVPQITSVILGLNIGAFQIWNLSTLQLEYTNSNTCNLPITHIAFLEPCDDPRAFSYIWIIHSVHDRHEDGFPVAAMYSLTYQEKQNINEQHCIYQNFISCNLRFNIDLSYIDGSNNLSRNFTGGRCISCRSLVKAPNKDDTDEYVLNICQIVWECWTLSTISPVHSMMVLFDIDQWYKEHMPECSALQTNNYMSVINLSDTLTHPASSYLCDVKINSETLTSYFSVQRLEEHFFPNALGYECLCLTNNDITKILTMGIQRQLLASINEIGPSVLLHPTKIFQQCINSGLIPLYIEPYPNLDTPEHMQRQVLLSIVLEARLIQFLGKCACDWATGSHTSVGCTLQLLLDWSWKRALSLKQNGDRITIPFFNHSGITPDRNTVLQLDNCVRQLGHIASIYNVILEKCSAAILPGVVQEIQERQKVIQIVAQYFQVIQWFLNVGLLPEFHVDHLTENINNCLPYPIDSLTEFYQNRRLKLHCLNGENPAVEDLERKNCKLLFIDEFIRIECSEKKLKSLWIEDKSTINGLYPPPSLHSLLKIYLIPEIKEEHKHSLILYTLIDYAMIIDNERYENVIKRLMQFPTMFGLSNTAIKVTQAFWHLDHRDFQLALNQLQCVLAGGCLSQWQHNVVLSSLLVQKKTQSALQYLHVRKPYSSNENVCKLYDDWEACSNLFLSRGLVYEAFNLNKDTTKNLSTAEREDRLKIFFSGCKNMSLLSKVLLLPLSKHEETVFVKFLKSIDDPYSSDILVMYYLYRSRYIEAQKANEELKRLTGKSQLPYDITNDFSMKKEHVYKTETRDQLVDLYCKTLPPITRQLANYTSNNNSSSHKSNIPVPMTVSVQAKTPRPTFYKSTLLQETIDKASETWMNKSCIIRGLKRLHQIEETPFLCTPKLTKSISMFDEKMSTTPDETPSKKTKLNKSTNEASSEKIDNISPKLSNEIKTLLHTPVIERKSKWNPGSVSSQYSTEALSLRRESTPQSILKVRKLREYCNSSPMYSRYLAETDDEMETNSQYTQSDNLSRSIRFKIPSRNNSPSPLSEYLSDMHDSFSDLCNYDPVKSDYFNKHFSPTNISPRKSIHHSCTDNVHIKDSSFQESIRSLSPNVSSPKTKTSSPKFNSTITPIDSKFKDSSNLNNSTQEIKENNISLTNDVQNMNKSLSKTAAISFLCNSSIVNSTSILASDVSEEIISDASFATVAHEPEYHKSESNDSIIAIKSTESCKSFESSNYSQSGNDFDNMNKEPDTSLSIYKFQASRNNDVSLNVSNSKLTIAQTLGEDCIDDVENTSCGDHSNMNLNILGKGDSILNSVIDSDNSQKSDFGTVDTTDLENHSNIKNITNIPIDVITSFAVENDSEDLHQVIPVNTMDCGDNVEKIIEMSNENIELNPPISENIENNNPESEIQLNENDEFSNKLPTILSKIDDDHNTTNVTSFKNIEEIKINTTLVHDQFDEINEKLEVNPKQSDNNLSSVDNSVEKPVTPVKYTTSASISEINSTPSGSVEICTTPSKSSKTPKSRRQSKTPRESIDSDSDSVQSVQSSRRSLRSTSKLNSSITSQSSIDSDQESTSSLRKSRRSVLAFVKPNLSVIPEMSHTEDNKSWLNKTKSSIKDTTQGSIDIASYSSSRRLTRHQKSLLERSSSSIVIEKGKIFNSKINASVIDSVNSDCESVDSNVTSETLDPILLLDKNDYKGPPDPEESAILNEVYTFSRESSVISNRLEIESGILTKETTPDSVRSKRSRRSSRLITDLRESPARSNSPAILAIIQDESITESPNTKLRRQSFNRAIEALSTPRKSRRLSTDSKKSELEVFTTENETPKKISHKKETTESVETQILPSTSKETEVVTGTPKRTRKSKAASVHGESSVSNLDDITTPSRKTKPRKSIFNTPVTKKDRQSVVEETLHKQKFKRKSRTHEVVQPLKFIKE